MRKRNGQEKKARREKQGRREEGKREVKSTYCAQNLIYILAYLLLSHLFPNLSHSSSLELRSLSFPTYFLLGPSHPGQLYKYGCTKGEFREGSRKGGSVWAAFEQRPSVTFTGYGLGCIQLITFVRYSLLNYSTLTRDVLNQHSHRLQQKIFFKIRTAYRSYFQKPNKIRQSFTPRSKLQPTRKRSLHTIECSQHAANFCVRSVNSSAGHTDNILGVDVLTGRLPAS